MFSQWIWTNFRAKILGLLLIMSLTLGMASCGDRSNPNYGIPSLPNPLKRAPVAKITEVSPPEAIQKLRQILESYQPQITIVNPQPNQTVQDTALTVQLEVQDFPVYRDPQWGLGPHLEVILDDQPARSVYDLSEAIALTNLNPGTHTLKVFAASPWGESFKNEGAYAQTTFHIFTPTADRIPDPNLPQLTYITPTGTHGAEPILLDFYLSNAPLHLVAQESIEDNIKDWRIRAYINGEVFVLDQWEPIYLKGFDRGNNWVKLEIVDELGNPIHNVFNTTARLVTYDPTASDPLSLLMAGKITAEAARGIVDPNWVAPPTPEPAVEEIVTPSETLLEEEVIPTEPTVEETQTPTPVVEPVIQESLEPVAEEEIPPVPEPVVEEEVVPVEVTEELKEETPAVPSEDILIPDQDIPETVLTEESSPVAESENPSAWWTKIPVKQWRDTLKTKWEQMDFDSLNPFGKEQPPIEPPSGEEIPDGVETLPQIEETPLPVTAPEVIETSPEVAAPEVTEIDQEISPPEPVSEVTEETAPEIVEVAPEDLPSVEEELVTEPLESSEDL